MKKLILLISIGLMLGGCLKEPEPIGRILVEYTGKDISKKGCRRIINYPYFAFNPETKSYQVSCVFWVFAVEPQYLEWITEGQNFDIYSAGEVEGHLKIFDTSKIRTMLPKQVIVVEGTDLKIICITKETDKAYGWEKNEYSTIWISKIPNEEWVGIGTILWEDGDRVKEGRLAQ